MSFPSHITKFISETLEFQPVCIITEDDKEYLEVFDFCEYNTQFIQYFTPVEFTNGLGLLITKEDYNTLVTI